MDLKKMGKMVGMALGMFCMLAGAGKGAGLVEVDAALSELDDGTGNYYFKNQQVAHTDGKGRLVYMPTEDYTLNANALEMLLDNEEKVTLVIPKGTTLYLDEVLDIGSNTTIIAKGANIVQKNAQAGILHHSIKGYNYDAIKNVTIDTNFQGHAMTLFACKNVTVDGCL